MQLDGLFASFGNVLVPRLKEIYLDIGIHSISATVELPNGDRLKETLGGIRIQSPLTGVYSGNANFDVTDFDGLTDMLGGFGGGNDSGEEPTTDEEGEEPTEEEGFTLYIV